MKKILLIVVFSTFLVSFLKAQIGDLDSGLVLYMNFNQEELQDLSLLNSGVSVKENPASFATGNDLSKSLRIEGGSALQVELDTFIYSASAWVKTDIEIDNNLNKWFSLFQFYETGTVNNANGGGLWLGPSTNLGNNEEVLVAISNNSQNYYPRTMAGNIGLDDQWHHYLMNYNGSNYDIYVDGVKQTTYTGTSVGHTPLLKSSNPVIGVRYHSDGQVRTENTGNIDEVRFYSRSLYESEITELASDYSNMINEDLIVFLDFEGDITDKSGNDFPTTSLGTTAILSNSDNSFLSYSAKSGVKVEVPDTNAYAATFYFRSEEIVDESTGGLVPIQFREEGFPNDRADGEIAFLGGGTILANGEVISLAKTINSTGSFPRTVVMNIDFDNQWHHVAFNYVNGKYEIYLDGVKQTTLATSGGNVGLLDMINPIIGTRVFADDTYSETKAAWMDEVRIYGRSLSEVEINYLSTEKSFDIITSLSSVETQERVVYPTIISSNQSLKSDAQIVEVSVGNTSGQIISTHSELKDISAESLPDGLNFLIIKLESGATVVEKIIKE